MPCDLQIQWRAERGKATPMKLPKSIRIGGFTFKVERALKINSDGDCEGMFDIHNDIVWIKKGMGEQREAQVFLHEVVHAIGVVYCADTMSEEQVEGVSQGLFQFAQQMKWIEDRKN